MTGHRGRRSVPWLARRIAALSRRIRRRPHRLSDRVDRIYDGRGGYDHCLVLARGGPGLRPAARLYDPVSGRLLELATTQPGLQVYGGQFLTGDVVGRDGVVYHANRGLCLEAQNFPDAPNQPGFPSARLAPGDRYRHTLVLSFGCE